MDYFKQKLDQTDEAIEILRQDQDFLRLEVEDHQGRLFADKRVQLKRFQARMQALEDDKKYWMDSIRLAASDLSQSATASSSVSTTCQGQPDVTSALSCLKFLDAIAYKLTDYYDFELKDPSYVSLKDVLDAIDNWKWDFRLRLGERVTSKSPHHIFSEDEQRSQELWAMLRMLNDKTLRLLHDRCLLTSSGSGNRFLAISRSDHSQDRVQDLREIGLAMGLVDDKEDLTVVSTADLYC